MSCGIWLMQHWWLIMPKLSDFDTTGWTQAQKMLLALNLTKKSGELFNPHKGSLKKNSAGSKNFLEYKK